MSGLKIDEVTNILLNLSAGLHPDSLSLREVELLKDEYGENRMDELGYTKEWLRTHGNLLK